MIYILGVCWVKMYLFWLGSKAIAFWRILPRYHWLQIITLAVLVHTDLILNTLNRISFDKLAFPLGYL